MASIRQHAEVALAHPASTTTGELAAAVLVDGDGPGIPEADRDRVLERFVRLDAARARDAGGSGLGLAIVAELVAAHGGTVGVARQPPGGARVEVSLRVTPDRR